MSLNLRFGFIAIGLLLTAVLTISYLFDTERTSIIQAREQEHLHYHTDQISRTLQHRIEQLRSDADFLAHTPPINAIRDILARSPDIAHDDRQFAIWNERLGVIFQALAYTRPEYQQLRLIAYTPEGPELLRVERQGADFIVVTPQNLQKMGNRDYVRDAAALKPGTITLSPIDLKREHGTLATPEVATIRALSPIYAADGSLFALIVINLDMGYVFRSMDSMSMRNGEFLVADETGEFLYHSDSDKRMASEHNRAYRLIDEFPSLNATLKEMSPDKPLPFSIDDDAKSLSGMVLKYPLPISRKQVRYLTLIITQPSLQAPYDLGKAHLQIYLQIGGLLTIMIILIVLVTRRLTHSLREMVRVSHAVSQGDYDVEIPDALGRDMRHLSGAFKHMTETLKQRESELKRLNQTLDSQVAERTQALKASHNELYKERQLLQSIIDNVGDGVLVLDGEGRILFCNRKAQQVLGPFPIDLKLEDWPTHFGLHSAADTALMSADQFPLVSALKGKTIHQQELYIQNPHNPGGRWINLFSRPLYRTQGVVDGAVAVLVDIEEDRARREQLDIQSNELAKIGRLTLIGQIIDTIAHRLSQPLAAIANYAGAALQMQASNSLDDERLKQVLNLISQQTERGGICLSDLRALRMRGSQPPGRVNINQVVESAYQLLEDRLNRYHISIERLLQPNLPTLIGQNVELQQAVVHLMINAQESLITRDQPRRLRLSSSYSPQTQLLEIAIGDNGPGLAPESCEQIFEPWYTTKPEALGLGLSVARSIIEDHNGQVELRDQHDEFTWFVIELPVEHDEHE
jgi:C4-dicarboxylate-specific signal transduction histidine kinase